MSSFTLFNASFIWTFIWQSTLCLLIGLLICKYYSIKSGQAHFILFLALAAGLILPVSSTVVRHQGWGVLPSDNVHAEAVSTIATEMEGQNAIHMKDSSPISSIASEINNSNLLSIIKWSWLVISAILLVRLLISFLAGIRLLATAKPLINEPIYSELLESTKDIPNLKPPIIFTTNKISCPAIWCWSLHPSLLLPQSMKEPMEKVKWSAVFRHELAHRRRNDHITNVLAELVVCLLFWQPLAWIAAGKLRLLSDQACDEWALRNGEPAHSYMETLLALVPRRCNAATLSMAGSKKGIQSRIRNILDKNSFNPVIGKGWGICSVAVTAMLIMAMACTQTKMEPTPMAEQADNTVLNSGIQNGNGAPLNWDQGKPVPGVNYIWDKGEGYDDMGSLCFEKTVKKYFPIAEWRQEFNVDPSINAKQIKATAWVKAENASKAVLDVQFIDGNGKRQHKWAAYIGAKKAGDPPADHDWMEYSGTVDIPDGAQKIVIAPQMYGPGKIWFDNISVTYVAE